MEYMLAPMEGLTSDALRTLSWRHGADLTFTEMARLEALARKNMSTWSRILFSSGTPTEIQLLGVKEVNLRKFLSVFKPQQGFKGFNLNLGCPDPKVVGLGMGCALVRRVSKVRQLTSVIRDFGYPVSIKMRLGLNQADVKKKVYLHLIEGVDADYFIVHSRHGKQSYSDPADHSVFEACVKTGKAIIANGGIRTKDHVERLRQVGVRGVMIGRAATIDPQIFSSLKGLPRVDPKALRSEYLELAISEPEKYRQEVLRRITLNPISQ